MLAVCIKFNTKFFSSRLCVSRVMCSSFSVHRFGKFLPGGRKSGLYHSINRPGNIFLANSFCHLKIFLVNKICVKLDWPFYYYPAAGFVFKLCSVQNVGRDLTRLALSSVCCEKFLYHCLASFCILCDR